MNASLAKKLQHLLLRHEELEALLGTQEVAGDPARYSKYSKEYSDLTPLVTTYAKMKSLEADKEEYKGMLKDSDADMKAMAQAELPEVEQKLEELDAQLEVLLLPKDPNDDKNIYLEIRAGTGGDEAAIFVGDLFNMYRRYAENQGWRLEVMNASDSEQGGYKELVAKVSGESVYAKLKFESGAHRVQRVPATESQGRIHTSACTVAVLPEADEVNIQIDAKDLRIDTYRASGAGGQHVNRTDSAVRITHIPTGVVVECQDERSQHKNKARAMSVLAAKLDQAARDKAQSERASERKSLVGSGDRSERIRTYNYPQGRVTDHRINLTLYSLDEIMQGGLDAVVMPLVKEHTASLLAEQ